MSTSTLYPKITQHVAEVVKNLKDPKHASDRPHEDLILEPIPLVGSVKLHGTHADILVYNGGEIVLQSKNVPNITVANDNLGFAAAMADKTTAIREIRDRYLARWNILHSDISLDLQHPVLIAGEWIGANIQKDVAISQLLRRFVIISVNINGSWIQDTQYPDIEAPASSIYNISRGGTFTATLYPHDVARTLSETEPVAEAIASSCPFAASFGVYGEGEGVVWKPAPPHLNSDPAQWFKTKGGRFKPTFAPAPKTLSRDVQEKRDAADELAALWSTEERMQQGWAFLAEVGVKRDMKGLARFLKWVQSDVLIEEKGYIEDNDVDEGMLRIGVAKIAKLCFSQLDSEKQERLPFTSGNRRTFSLLPRPTLHKLLSQTTKMSPAKRMATPPPSNMPKRRRLPTITDINPTANLTARNTLDSPLLRLPAELRNLIWTFAFGDQIILVRGSRSSYDAENHLVDFRSLDAFSSFRHATLKVAESSFTPKLVCRQFWAETSQVFLSSCTFRVDHAHDFRKLALSKQPVVPKIRRLMICLGSRTHNFPMYWHDVFTSSLVGRFTSLEGVTFTGEVCWGPKRGGLDVMNGSHWKMRHLPNTIRSFQQHKLRENLTLVDFKALKYPREFAWDAAQLNEAIPTAPLKPVAKMPPATQPPKAILFDIGGVVVISPFQAILDYEIANKIPIGYINYAIQKGPHDTGAWQLIERGEVELNDDWFASFKAQLSRSEIWREYLAKLTQSQSLGGAGGAAIEGGHPTHVPEIDAKRLFWRMMKISREPDPYMYPALRRLKASGKFVLGAFSNNVTFPTGILDDEGVLFTKELQHRPHPNPHANDPTDMTTNFDIFLGSAAVGVRKPDPEAYKLATREMSKISEQKGKGKISEGDVLFLDDIGINLKFAKKTGLRTIKVNLGQTKDAVKELEEATGLKLLDEKARLEHLPASPQLRSVRVSITVAWKSTAPTTIMLLVIFSLLIAAAQAQNSTAASVTQIAVYPPFPIRDGTNMQHTQRAYDVSLITAISSTTLVYAISCSPWTTMTRFNDVCGTSYVPEVITVTESPDEWHWSAQGKSLVCSNLREKTKTCTSVSNNYGSYIAPGTQSDFLAGFLEYYTTMTPVAVNLTAGFENVPATVLASLEDDATGIVTIQTGSPTDDAARSTTESAPVLTASTGGSAPTETASTGAAPKAIGVVRHELLFGAAGALGVGVFGL
ncbi:hypothetical protein OPT61_g16 [Boeremia exigua]|uniref:Uncharacterized protein n=1 Tax=Boeremia exigua TaxID=749465 RepID=A0ACC2IV85_9PLEO|nr:hypothetical protein OPT61_g16 [Boeremia exigua]